MNGTPTSDGSSTNPYCIYHDQPLDWCGHDERSVDEIYEAVRQALAALEDGQLVTVSLLTGISIEKLIELGGTNDA